MKNIAARIDEMANLYPAKKAVVARAKNGNYEHLTFKELVDLSHNFAFKLKEMGLKKGDKTLVFVRPGLDFPVITFALFRLGVVPVFIDPGMGRENLFRAITNLKPQALIAVPEVHIARLFFRAPFKGIKHFVTTGSLTYGKMKSIKPWKKDLTSERILSNIDEQDMAAILFTSGGTGIPKGVVYTHKIFNTQTDTLKELFSLSEKEVDIPGFPLFAFFTMAMGMTSCIPEMDPSKPAKCDPKKLVQNINDHQGTFVAGSPAIWERVANYCVDQNLQLHSVKYLVMFGAPVSPELHKKFQKVLPNGTTYTPYGATESLPVANVEGHFLLENTVDKTDQGLGTCVGKVAPNIEVKIIAITDDVIETIDQANILRPYELGEIIVKGDVVTKEYYQMPKKTAEAKIYDGEGLWHRMGDLGYLDQEGLLWFCGRKSYRVTTKEELKSSIQCESIYNNHKDIHRTALIGIGDEGKQRPALVIERKDKKTNFRNIDDSFKRELIELSKSYEHTKDIETFYLADQFPVDVRHNIKIDRLKLRDQAINGKLKEIR